MVQEIAELKVFYFEQTLLDLINSGQIQVKNQTLVVENKAFGEKLKETEEKAQKLEQLHTNLHNVEEFCKEMAALKEQQQKAVNWDQMKPDVLWARLFGIGI
jgi:regulator of sigma D